LPSPTGRRNFPAASDEHYAALAEVATVNQLRTAIKLEPRPQPDPQPERQRSITKTSDGHSTIWKITLPKLDAAKFMRRCSHTATR
jgi:hypothetical protein